MLDHDRSSASRRMITALDNRRELAVQHFAATLADTHRLLDQGEATLVVIIPAGFAAGIVDISRTTEIQLVADASSSVPARYALNGAQGDRCRFHC